MDVQFDYFGLPEIPYIILCNPDKTELYSLGLSYDTELELQFNALSGFKFSFPQSIDGGATILDAYDYIQNKRLVLIEGYGYFLIVNSEEELTGAVPTKKVTCSSLEADLISKRITGYGGTVSLYNIISPEGTLLYDMIQLAPTWSIGSIDAELMVKFRTFSVSDTNIYEFLMNEVCKAFECVFFFDTVTKTISAKTLANATTETDIFLSFDNLIKEATFSEKSDEITTCLSVYGGGDLNIRAVNPLGTDKIYDFSYYANSNWMSAGLVTAINNWNNLVDSYQADYADLLSLLFDYNAELISLNGDLATLQAELLALETVQKTRIQAGQSYSDINAQMVAKQNQITAQQVLISNKQIQIDNTLDDIHVINQDVSFSENFTPLQLLELNNFIYENTYKNENIIQTDTMSTTEVQEAQQALYNQAITVLQRVSQPRYEIVMDSANYTLLEEFSVFTVQTQLGSEVVAELKNGIFIEAVLLKLSFSFNDPLDFKITFSNRLRIDGSTFIYSDLMGSVVKTGSAVSFDSAAWGNWSGEYKDDVTTFISSALDTTRNNIISNSNQEILINQNGLRARQKVGSTYSGEQLWMANNVLAFSDNGFQTAKLALGKISIPGGGTAYGLVAEVIVGNLLAGNSLRISNTGPGGVTNFTLDQNGAVLTNAKFTLSSTNTQLILDSTASRVFDIKKNEGGTFNSKFWVDNAGNVNFAGILSGATGSFSGTLSAAVGNLGTLVIDSQGLKTADGVNYLRGNGDLKWGGLSITGASATFTGNIFADKLVGAVSYNQLTDIPFQKITTGQAVTGTQLKWPGNVSVSSLGSGFISIRAPIEIEISSFAGSFVLVDGAFITMYGSDSVEIGSGNVTSIYSGDYIRIDGNVLSVNGGEEGFGFTGTFNPNSFSHLYVVNGLIVDFY